MYTTRITLLEKVEPSMVLELLSPCAMAPNMSQSIVLNDDLLNNILLLVDSPTTLLRAALVSKCWYHDASSRPSSTATVHATHPVSLVCTSPALGSRAQHSSRYPSLNPQSTLSQLTVPTSSSATPPSSHPPSWTAATTASLLVHRRLLPDLCHCCARSTQVPRLEPRRAPASSNHLPPVGP
jgi:hypothetical protein